MCIRDRIDLFYAQEADSENNMPPEDIETRTAYFLKENGGLYNWITVTKPDGDVYKRQQQAFIDEAAVQCGFCTPGFIMSATELLQSGIEYSDDEIRKLLSGHLCRCTGYENIFRAVQKTMLRRLGKDKEADEV